MYISYHVHNLSHIYILSCTIVHNLLHLYLIMHISYHVNNLSSTYLNRVQCTYFIMYIFYHVPILSCNILSCTTLYISYHVHCTYLTILSHWIRFLLALPLPFIWSSCLSLKDIFTIITAKRSMFASIRNNLFSEPRHCKKNLSSYEYLENVILYN